MSVDARPPHVSRDTRRLLIAAGLAVVCLWALARLRFPETPMATNPVPPLLAQLAPPMRFSDLSAEVDALTSRLEPLLSRVSLRTHDDRGWRLAVPIKPGVAAAVVERNDANALPPSAGVTAVDRPSGLILVRSSPSASPPRLATDIDIRTSRYLFAASAGGESTVIRPVFVPRLPSLWSRRWNANAWRLDASTPVSDGDLMFTASGEFVGVVTKAPGDEMLLIPISSLQAAIDQLLSAPAGQGAGSIGVYADTLTASLRRVTGATTGVVVTWVDPMGPGQGQLVPGDIIASINGEPTDTTSDWDVLTGRLRPGDALQLRVLQGAGDRDVTLYAEERPAHDLPLGLQLRRVTAGAEVIAVDGRSAAGRTLQPGDVITQIGDSRRPGPRDVQRLFNAAEVGVLILFTRDGIAHAAALER